MIPLSFAFEHGADWWLYCLKNMKDITDVPVETISKATGLSVEQIAAL